MSNLGYLATAYLIVWGVLFAYLLRLGRRQRRLWSEIELLLDKVGRQERSEAP